MASKSLDDVLEFYGKTCQFRGCVDVPVKSFGKQMDVVLWSCPKCGKERLLFYELQLELDYDKWSRKLLRRYLQCKVFRAFCIMYKRFDRLGYVIGYAKQSNEIRNVLNEWYETQNYAVPNYMTAYMFKNQLPSKKAHEKMSRLLSKNGNALLYNRPFVLPGVEGAFEPAIPDPLKHRSKVRQYPLRQHFYAFNDLQLNHFIRNFEAEENYEMATFFQKRKNVLPQNWPDFTMLLSKGQIDDKNRLLKKEKKREQNIQRREESYKKYYQEIEGKPIPTIETDWFSPYPAPINSYFLYHDFMPERGKFVANEEKYRVGDFVGYEIFKLKIKRAEKTFNLGHAHYLIRNKKDNGDNCIVVLMLRGGDTVVGVSYQLNLYREVEPSFFVKNRRDHDTELYALGINHILKNCLPPFFKVALVYGLKEQL